MNPITKGLNIPHLYWYN